MAFVVKTFGIAAIRRDQVITRGPRFQISFDANAAELVQGAGGQNDLANTYRKGPYQQSVFGNDAFNGQNESGGTTATASGLGLDRPRYSGRYELQRCKVDSVSLGIMPGRRVAAVRWEGVAEGITFLGDTIQTFKDNLFDTSPNGFNSRQAQGGVPGGPSGSSPFIN